MRTEKSLEKILCEKVKKKGGLAVKFSSATFTGMPDRIVLLPEGKIFFVEMKNEKGDLSLRQIRVIQKLRDLGFKVEVIHNLLEIQNFIDTL